MKKCCLCCSVRVGALFIGVVGLLEYAAFLLGSVFALLTKKEIMQEIYQAFYSRNDHMDVSQKEATDNLLKTVENYYEPVTITSIAISAVIMLTNLLMLCGIGFRRRGLVMPWLILEMFFILVFTILGVILVVTTAFAHYLVAIITGLVLLTLLLFWLYFWCVVRAAYAEIVQHSGYEPALSKPTYNPHEQFSNIGVAQMYEEATPSSMGQHHHHHHHNIYPNIANQQQNMAANQYYGENSYSQHIH